MKLHLPKLLRNSVLACITAVAGIATTTVGTATFTGGVVAFALSSQQAMGATYLQGENLYYIGGPTQESLPSQTITGVSEATPEGGKLTTTITEIDATGKTTVELAADSNANPWTNAVVETLKVTDGSTVDVKVSGWLESRYFDTLSIEHLSVADGGTVNLNISKAEHNVAINALTGTLGTVSLTGNLTLGFDTTFSSSGGITGTGTVTIASGKTMTVSTSNGNCGVQANVAVAAGASLILANGDALGWGGTAMKSITLQGSEDAQAKLEMTGKQTMTTNLNLNGYGVVNGGQLEFFGGAITATGTDNVIGADIYCRSGDGNAGVITVTGAEDTLEITGTIKAGSQGQGAISKAGAGTLTLSGADNIFYKGFAINGGVVNVNAATTVQGGALALAQNAALTIGNNSTLTVSYTGGPTTIAQDASVTVETGSTLNIGNNKIQNDGSFTLNGTLAIGDVTAYDVTGDVVYYNISGEGGVESQNGYASSNKFLIVGGNVTLGATGAVTGTGVGSVAVEEGVGLVSTSDTALINTSTFYINSLKVTYNEDGYTDFGAATYILAEGTELDVKGNVFAGKEIVLGAGATLSNTGANLSGNDRQMQSYTLEGDATINAAANMGLIGFSWGPTTMDLNGHTLTKTGGGALFLVNTTVNGGGTIVVEQGILQAGIEVGYGKDKATTANEVDIQLAGGSLNISQTGNTLTAASVSGEGTINGAGKLILSGTAAVEREFTGSFDIGSLQITGTDSYTINGAFNTHSATDDAGNVTATGNVELRGATAAINLTTGGTIEGEVVLSGAGASISFGGETGTTYETGIIRSTDRDGYNRMITVAEGVTVNVAATDGKALQNSWGIGTLTVDGTMNLNGDLYLSSGSNNSAANNLIAGQGIVNAESMTLRNAGTYNFNIHELNVAGATAMSCHLNMYGGTVNLQGTVTGNSNAILLNGGTLNLSGTGSDIGRVEILNDAEGNVNVGGSSSLLRALNIYGGTAAVTGTDISLEYLRNDVDGDVSVENGAKVSVQHAVLGSTIANKGTLTFTDTITVNDLSGFTKKLGTGASYSNGDNGFLTGPVEYVIIDNTGSLTTTGVTLAGVLEGATLTNGCYVSSGTESGNLYYVNKGEVTATSLGEGKNYTMSGGTLVIDASTVSGLTQEDEEDDATFASRKANLAGSILLSTTGNAGTVKLTTDATFTAASTLSTADLLIAGTGEAVPVLTVGTTENSASSIASFKSVTLDKGKLVYNANATTLNTLTVTNNGGALHFSDYGSNLAEGNATVCAGTTTLNGDLTVTAGYDYSLKFATLTGTGDLYVSSSANNTISNVFIGSMSGYEGSVYVRNYTRLHLQDAAWTGEVVYSGGTDSRNLTMFNTDFGGKACQLVFNGYTGHLAGVDNKTLSVDIELRNNTESTNTAALVLNNNSSQQNVTSTFAGAIKGSGDIKYTWATGGTGVTSAHVFSGDTSSWGGWFISGSGAGKMVEAKFTSGGNVFNAASNGGVKDERTEGYHLKVTIDAGETATTFNGAIVNAASLTVNSDTTFKKNVSTTALSIGANADVLLGSGTTMTVTNGVSVGADQGFGTTGAATLNNALTFNGGSLTLGGALALGDHVLTLSSTNKTTLALASNMLTGGAEINLFTGVSSLEGITLTPRQTTLGDIFSVEDANLAGYYLVYDSTNKTLSIAYSVAENRTWSVDDADNGGVWEETKQFGAETTDVFESGDIANFGTLTAAESVTIKGTVDASSVVINAGAGQTYTFSAHADGGVLNVGTLSVASGTAVFANNTLQISSLASNSVSIAEDAVLDLSAYRVGACFEKMSGAAAGSGTIKYSGGTAGSTGNNEPLWRVSMQKGITLNTDVEVLNDLALNAYAIGDKSTAIITTSKNLKVGGELRLESGAKLVLDNGTAEIGTVALCHSDTGQDYPGHVYMTGDDASLKTSGIILSKSVTSTASSFYMVGGTLEITSSTGIASGVVTTITGGRLIAGDGVAWGATGATIGGAIIGDSSVTTATGTITLTNSTLTDKLTLQSGTLKLAGTIEINPTGGFDAKAAGDPRYYAVGSTTPTANGFRFTTMVYTLAEGNGTLTVADDVTWKIDGTALTAGDYTYADKKLTANTADGTLYWVNSGTVNYGSVGTEGQEGYVAADNMTGATGISLAGGTLQLNSSLQSELGITKATGGSGIIKLNGETVELSSSQITGTGSATLTGNGVLNLGTVTDLGDGNNTIAHLAKVTGLTDTSWTGIVKVSGTASGVQLGNAGNADSWVEVAGLTGWITEGTCGTNIRLTGDGIVVADNSQKEYTFSKAIAGSGDFTVKSSSAYTPTYNFTGNLENWAGAFAVEQHDESTNTPTVNLNFTGGGNLFTGADGSGVVFNRGGILNVTIGNTSAATAMRADIVNNGEGTLNLTAVGSVTMEGTLADGVAVTSNGTLKLTQDTTTLASLAGTGAVEAEALVLKGATNTVGDLTLSGGLTLGVAATDTAAGVVSKLTASTLDITGDVVVNNLGANLISAGAAATDSTAAIAGLKSNLNFMITDTQLEKYMEANTVTSITLGSIAGMTATDWVKAVSLNKTTDAATNRWDADNMTYLDADGQYSYKLSADANGVLTLNQLVNGQAWDAVSGTEDCRWSTAASWSSDTAVDEDDSVQFTGLGSKEVYFGQPGEAPQKETLVINNVTFNVDTALEGYATSEYVFKRVEGTDWNTLDIKKNLTLTSGKLTVEAGVNIYSEGSTIVSTDAELHLGQQAFVRAEKGIHIGGTVTVDTFKDGEGVTSSTNGGQLYVIKGGNIDITTAMKDGNKVAGNVAVSGILAAVGGTYEYNDYLGNKDYTDFSYNANGSDINNAGSIINTGIIIAEGDMVNNGTLAQSGGNSRLWVYGNLSNTGAEIAAPAQGETKTPGMSITGGSVVVGTLTNSDTVNLSGASLALNGYSYEETDDATNSATTVTKAAKLTNTGALSIANGAQVTVGSSTAAGSVDNDGTITIGGAKDADGKITTGMLVHGDLDNTNGTIKIGSAETDTAAATYGSLTVTGNLTGTGSADKLVVEEGSSLDVGGDLAAANVDLAFGGTVTVGGTATVKNLNIAEKAEFSAHKADITGILTNDGTLKVTSVTGDDGTVVSAGSLSINQLTGSGEVFVDENGTLSIGSQVNFTGSLTGGGKLTTGNQTFTLLTKQADVTETSKATDITASSLVVDGQWMKDGAAVNAGTAGATWASANGSILGNVTTGSITFTKLDTTGATHLTLNSLTATEGDSVKLVLTQLGTEAGINELIATGVHTYNLLSIAGDAATLTMDALNADREQQLLKSGLKLGDLQTSTTMALRATGTQVSISVLNQTLEDATWDTAKDSTEIGLDLGTLTDGTMVLKSNDMLDNVQSVKVTADTKLDLSSVDTDAVNIKGLTGAKNLSIAGNGDTVNISTLAGGYEGTLSLDKVKAAVAGTVETMLLGTGTAATLAVDDTVVVVKGTGVQLTGGMTDGALVLGSDASVTGSNLVIDGTEIGITRTETGNKLDTGKFTTTKDGRAILAELDGVSGTTDKITIGQYNAATDEFEQSALYAKYFDTDSYELTGGKIVADRNTVYYTGNLADGSTSENGAAGLTMADEALLYANPQQLDPTGDLAAVLDQLDAMVASGNKAAADELGASLAGASTAVLGMAAQGDVDRQLRAIRNRTTTMGVDQSVVNADMPYFNAWINAEGDNREMNDDGTLGGYKLNSYGGTVGFDVDIEPTFTAGMALTAMYGDLDATGAAKASGDMDTTYVSAFARYCASAWTHTFVATAGMGDISLDRTVGGAQVQGETDSMSFGLMYEVGRVYALDEDGTACLQPVFNVAWRHTTVDAYTEKGSDLALEVGEQTLDTITIGLGARVQAVVGESVYNRTSIFECRLLAKADVGDREGTADVMLSGVDNASTREVTSAEVGAFGLEVGAGLTIPLGDEGSSIFMDASAELRADYTNVNGTVGYRVNF